MDVSPQLIREIEFREQWRGYSPDEVDDFLERLAVAVEELQERLRQLSERPPATGDEELRRTLVLAQRTADAAVAEAREEAARLVSEAEERARRVLADAQAQAQAQLGELTERRAALEADVEVLTSYIDQHRGRLRDELREHLEWLEGSGRLQLPPRPSLSSSQTPAPPAAAEPEATGLYDVLADDDQPADLPPPAHPAPEEGPPVDEIHHDSVQDPTPAGDAHDDDPFMAELRRAVNDPEPLGPRHHAGGEIDLTEPDDTGELTPSSRIRRRRRR